MIKAAEDNPNPTAASDYRYFAACLEMNVDDLEGLDNLRKCWYDEYQWTGDYGKHLRYKVAHRACVEVIELVKEDAT
jgi:hypothetical protein